MRDVQGGQVDGLKAEVFVTSILKIYLQPESLSSYLLLTKPTKPTK